MQLPLPHLDGQMVAFPAPVETAFGPLRMTFTIGLERLPRARCTACGMRRILYRVSLSDDIAGPALCARDAGIR